MSRGYHLTKTITLADVTKNTSIEVIDRKTESDRFALRDQSGNSCIVNMSMKYDDESLNCDTVKIRTLDFHGGNLEAEILHELYQKFQVLFYTDAELEDCLNEGRPLGPIDVASALNRVLGLSLTEQQVADILKPPTPDIINEK